MVREKSEEFQYHQQQGAVAAESGLNSPYDDDDIELDDDGRPKRTGTAFTAGAHIVTAIIGSGVLSLAWCVAQLGWIAGAGTLMIFAGVTLYTCNLLADCYRYPDPVTGKRNYSYMEAVRAYLGGRSYLFCGVVQYANLTGMIIGYTITASTSMVAVRKSNCFHKKGHGANCKFSNNPYMIGLGIFEIFLSQIPDFNQLSWLSTVAALMSFGYASIGVGLALTKVVTGQGGRTTLTGVEVGIDVSSAQKIYKVFQALGDIAFAYVFSQVMLEIQDTLKSPPAENKVMKKGNLIGVIITTSFYTLCGCLGYAAFGNDAPGNMLTGFGFYEPYWLIDVANVFIVVHLVGAYQVFAQPVYSALERSARMQWPNSKFVNSEYPITPFGNKKLRFRINLLRLVWRTVYVILATILAMALPFFNDILALLGAIGYWPLSVYFPVTMYIAQNKISRRSRRWLSLQVLNVLSFLVSLVAAVGSIEGISQSITKQKPFMYKE